MTRAISRGPGERRPGRPLQTYFVALAALVVVVAAAAAGYVYVQSAADARSAATDDARFAAQKVSAQLDSSFAFIDQTLEPLSTDPSAGELFTHPERCTLGYAPIGAFGGGHIDLIGGDGQVLCTSRSSGRGENTYAGAFWLSITRPTIVAPLRDPATGAQVAVIAYPVTGYGLIVWFAELAAVGPNLAAEFGTGVDDLEFLITSADGKAIVARSVDSQRWTGASLAGSTFLTSTDPVDRNDVSGVARWYAETAIARTGWKVFVGASQVHALSSAAQLQQRQLTIIAVGVLAILAGMLVAYRRLVSPIANLTRAVQLARSLGSAGAVPVAGPREVARLGEDIRELIVSLNRQLSERDAAEETYARLFTGNPLPMIVSNTAGQFIDVNEASLTTFGYTRDEFMQLKGPQVFAPANDEELAELMGVRSRLESDPAGPAYVHYGPITFRKKDGSLLRAVGTTYRVELAGKPAWVGMLEDVTLKEKLERQMKQAERLESLGQLAGGVAHDFNNLLAVILNSTASLKDAAAAEETPPRETRRDLDRIDKAAQSAARLTRQLLAFARRETLTGAPLDLAQHLRGLTDLLRRTIGSHIVLTATLPDGVWPVRMDPGQLEQVVINLAVNARDAMGKGGRLEISVDKFEADVAFTENKRGLKPGRYVRLQVSDSGTGMDRETLDHLFEPFFTTKPVGHGTGLGLATVYGIVTQLQGHVGVYSEVGIGTTFTILLPATEADVAQAAQPAPRAKAGARGATILVVEDYSDLRELFDELLTEAGFHVITASDGASGLEAARLHQGEIDLVLTDIVMPNMLGSDLARRLRIESPGMKVIYMSGHAQPVLGGAVALDPTTPLLQKPFMEAELLAKVEEVLAGSQARQPA